MLAGVLACLRQTGKTAQDLKDQRIVNLCAVAGSSLVLAAVWLRSAVRNYDRAGVASMCARRLLISEKEGRLGKNRRWCLVW